MKKFCLKMVAVVALFTSLSVSAQTFIVCYEGEYLVQLSLENGSAPYQVLKNNHIVKSGEFSVDAEGKDSFLGTYTWIFSDEEENLLGVAVKSPDFEPTKAGRWDAAADLFIAWGNDAFDASTAECVVSVQ